ncbi:MAG: hypothetical protein AB7G13_17715 [Lautropia sp.]
MIRTAIAVALTAAVCACTTPPQQTESTRDAVAPPAPRIDWQPAERQSYEAREPGLGESRGYRATAGRADSYVYGLRRADWRDGTADPAFDAHFREVADQALQGVRRTCPSLAPGRTGDFTIAGQAFRGTRFDCTMADGRPLASFAWLGARNGQLLKYRVTLSLPDGGDAEAAARAFVAADLFHDPSARRPLRADELLGQWRWRLPSGCVETISFMEAGRRRVVSGEETTESVYSVRSLPGSMFRELNVQTTVDLRGKDCGGDDDDDTGQTFNAYFAINRTRDQIVFCSQPDLRKCLGPYRRITETRI